MAAMAIDKQDLINFLFDETDPETAERIVQEYRSNPTGEVALYFNQFEERMRRALDVDWKRLLKKRPEDHESADQAQEEK